MQSEEKRETDRYECSCECPARMLLMSENPLNTGLVTPRPGTSSKAIAAGTQALRDGSPEKAIELFQEALELPGNGVMRFAGTVREYR